MPPKGRGGKSTSRRNTPISPPKPVSPTGSPSKIRRSGRGASRNDEDTIQLHRDSVELSLQPIAEANEKDVEATGGVDTGASSIGSEGTEFSSVTQEELDTLDYDFIVDSLADLYRESLKVIRFIGDTHSTAPDSLRDLASKHAQRLRYHYDKFRRTCESFDTGRRVYIIPSTIVRKLRDGEEWALTPDGKWRPDAILYLANIAQLLAASFLNLANQLDEYFYALFTYYPRIFSASFPSRFCTQYTAKAIEFANEFRTQYFVYKARKDQGKPDHDPDTLLHDLFYDAEGQIRGFEITGMDVSPATVESRIVEIRKFVTTNSRNPVKVGQLEKAFPLASFFSHVVEWANIRASELEAQIAAQGGIDHIVDCIQNENFSPLDYEQHRVVEETLPIDPQLFEHTSSKKKRQTKRSSGARLTGTALEKEVAHLKNLQAEKEAAARVDGPSRGREQAPEIGGSPTRNDDPLEPNIPYNNALASNDDEDILIPTQMTRDVEEVLENHARESNKENIECTVPRQRSFLDKQSNARKVPFHDAQPSGKRQRTDEDSEDEEFEEDQRSPAKQARKGKAPRNSTRPRTVDREDGLLGASAQPTRSPLQPQSTSHPPLSTAPARAQDGDGELPRSTQWADANAAAKMAVKLNRERNVDLKVQNRKPWTQGEVERLLELIEINGPKYAKILMDDKNPELYPDGPMLEERNQVQLKDKARNMKLDFIKGRHRLPDGFSAVSIGKRHIGILRDNFGIDYINGDGRGDNTGRNTE